MAKLISTLVRNDKAGSAWYYALGAIHEHNRTARADRQLRPSADIADEFANWVRELDDAEFTEAIADLWDLWRVRVRWQCRHVSPTQPT